MHPEYPHDLPDEEYSKELGKALVLLIAIAKEKEEYLELLKEIQNNAYGHKRTDTTSSTAE